MDVLNDPTVRRLLDFGRPMGVLILGVLHFVPEDEVAYNLVRVLRDAVVSGSYLAISHGTKEHSPQDLVEQGEQLYSRTTDPLKLRTRAEIEAFFAGLDLVEPGVVLLPLWRPEGPDDLFLDQPERAAWIGGGGRKPTQDDAR
jgi:hypothetical protein